MQYIRDIDPVLAPHADLFRKHVCISHNGEDPTNIIILYCGLLLILVYNLYTTWWEAFLKNRVRATFNFPSLPSATGD